MSDHADLVKRAEALSAAAAEHDEEARQEFERRWRDHRRFHSERRWVAEARELIPQLVEALKEARLMRLGMSCLQAIAEGGSTTGNEPEWILPIAEELIRRGSTIAELRAEVERLKDRDDA